MPSYLPKLFRVLAMLSMIVLVAVALVACAGDSPTDSDNGDPDPQYSDTVMVIDTTFKVGDTSAVSIFLSNDKPISGYSLRLIFDTTYLRPVTVPGNNLVISPVQVERSPGEGVFERSLGGHPEPTVVTIIATHGFGESWSLPAGRGVVAHVFFHAVRMTPPGTRSIVEFQDSPLDSNAYNWLVDEDAKGQHRPHRLSGNISIIDE